MLPKAALYIALVLVVCCGAAQAQPAFGPASPVSELNSSMADGAKSISPEGLTVYIESHRFENRSRIYSATRPDLNSPFTPPSDAWFVNINNTPGTHNVGGPLISADGLTLIYGASNKIYSATRSNTTSPFGPGVLLPNINGIGDSPESTRDDWLSPDGLRLYMSVRSGGQWDMYLASRATTGSPFGIPSTNLFVNLNTAWSEFEATLSADELQIIFLSDRPGGVGGPDLWWASRPDRESPFGMPVNLTSINSVYRDRTPLLFGNTLFFSSTRATGIEDEQAHDIYQASILESVLAAVRKAIADGALTGIGPGASGNQRLNSWVNTLLHACNELQDAYSSIDGVSPDVVTGSGAPALAAAIQAVRRQLGCF
jgi:hypothetical protein